MLDDPESERSITQNTSALMQLVHAQLSTSGDRGILLLWLLAAAASSWWAVLLESLLEVFLFARRGNSTTATIGSTGAGDAVTLLSVHHC